MNTVRLVTPNEETTMAGPRTAARFAIGSMTLFVGLLLAVLLWAPDAHAAAQWTTPVELGTAIHEFTFGPNAQVAVNAGGDEAVVWASRKNLNATIYAVTKSRGGSWSPRAAVSTPGRGAANPQVGIDDAGNVTVLWESYEAGHQFNRIEAATRTAAEGSWSSPETIAPLEIPCGCSAELQLAVSAEGSGVVAWVSDRPGEPEAEEEELVYTAIMQPGGSWLEPTAISGPARYNAEPSVAIDGSGNATAVWAAYLEEESVIDEASMQVGNLWSAPVTVSNPPGGTYEERPKVAVDARGDAALVWERAVEEECGCAHAVTMGMTRPEGGSWTEPAEISPPGDESFSLIGPRLGLDGAGVATAVWTGTGPHGIPAVEAVNSSETGPWLTPSFLEPEFTSAGIFAQVAVAPTGKAVAIWDALNEEGDATLAATMSGGVWSAPQMISNSWPEEIPSVPEVDVDAAGNATAVWEHFTGSTYLVETSQLWEGVPLTVRKVGTDSGTIESSPVGINCGVSCHSETNSFEEGSEVAFTATAGPGYTFVGWTNCDTGNSLGEQCVVDATEGHASIGAEFRPVSQISVEKFGGGTGSVVSAPGGISCGVECVSASGTFRAGKKVTLKASRSPDSTFEGWHLSSGESCTLSNGGSWCTLTPREDTSVQAFFGERRKVAFSITKEGPGEGLIRLEPGRVYCSTTCPAAEGGYFADETVKVTLQPRNGSRGATWFDGGAGTCTEHALTCEVPASVEVLYVKFG
jgi:hypothetical protein